jgi:hypothetical protein
MPNYLHLLAVNLTPTFISVDYTLMCHVPRYLHHNNDSYISRLKILDLRTVQQLLHGLLEDQF